MLPCREAHSFQTIEDIDLKLMKIVSKFHVPIYNNFREIGRHWTLRTGRAGPKMTIKLYSTFLNDLIYMTANRNFVHSWVFLLSNTNCAKKNTIKRGKNSYYWTTTDSHKLIDEFIVNNWSDCVIYDSCD